MMPGHGRRGYSALPLAAIRGGALHKAERGDEVEWRQRPSNSAGPLEPAFGDGVVAHRKLVRVGDAVAVGQAALLLRPRRRVYHLGGSTRFSTLANPNPLGRYQEIEITSN
jgi:hypothetical protein